MDAFRDGEPDGAPADAPVEAAVDTGIDAGMLSLHVEDAPGGAGSPVGARALTVGASVIVYAILRAEDGSFVSDASVTWDSGDGSVATVSPVEGTSTQVTAVSIGVVSITATHASYGSKVAGPFSVAACTADGDCVDPCYSAGLIACVEGTCTPVGAADKDVDGDGYVDGRCEGGDDCDDDPAGCGAACAPGLADTCDGRDNDCDASTADGADDPMLGGSCDGPDSDLCGDDALLCSGGALVCSTGTDDLDLCNGVDDDCDASTADGADDPMLGTACDGPDSDLCSDDALLCSGGALVCSTGRDEIDLCNGLDDDCDASTADGADDPMLGTACDGPDSDLCSDDALLCSGGALVCSTGTDDLDLCNGMDDDCDASTADGADDPLVGTACDGPDSDFCSEGSISCAGGLLACSDATGDSVEGPSGDATCSDSVDNDCDGDTDASDADCASVSTTVLPAVADTYLHGLSGPNGAETIVLDGRDNGGPLTYTLVRFDLSSIPGGTSITSARLRLYQASSGRSGTLNVHATRITRDWDEATADFNNASAGTPWTTVGGDHDPTPIDTTAIPIGTLGWYEWDVTTQVQAWLDGTQPNYGFYLDWDSVSAGFWVGFASRENGTVSQRPELVITP